MYANKAGEVKEPDTKKTRASNNYIEKTDGSGITNSTSLLYDNGVSIGLGTSNPVAGAKLHINQSSGSAELMRLQNQDGNAFGRFTMYNNIASNYATFTKYGSAYAGGYVGISSLFPYANLLAFGNNGGGFLISNGGSVGISMLKAGTSKLKFYTDFTSENVGIGGAAVPSAQIHFNNSTSGDTLKITNNTTGHLATDGFDIRTTGNVVNLMNKENASITIGTNNLDRMTINELGHVGIGINLPHAPLQFATSVGNRKVVLYEGADNEHEFYGFGINSTILRYQVPGNGSNHVFYSGLNASSSSELMRIQGNGNIGIGTSTPSSKLEVNGQIKITGGNPGAGKVLTSDANGLANWTNSGGASVNGAINHLAYFNTASTVTNGLLTTNSAGHLGINFAIPNAPLQFATALTNRKIVLYEQANNDHEFYGLGVNSSILRYQIPSTTSSHIFYSANSSTSSSELMRLTGTGKLGLGTSSPNGILQFAQTLESRKIVLFELANNANQYYGFGTNNGLLRYQVAESSADHVFYSGSSNATSQELFRIKGNGNIGIGNGSPNAPLQFAQTLESRKIVLYQMGNNDHQVYGFGINAGILRYQVALNTNSHVFYAGNSTTTSLELMRIVGNGNVGIATAAPTAKLSVNGTADKPGGGSWAVFSDIRLKKDISPYQEGLQTLLKINPIKFHYNEKSGCDTKPAYVGVIAQELKEIAPYMVGSFQKDNTEYLNVDNSAMTYLLINAVKELNAKLEKQEKLNTDLLKRLASLETK